MKREDEVLKNRREKVKDSEKLKINRPGSFMKVESETLMLKYWARCVLDMGRHGHIIVVKP